MAEDAFFVDPYCQSEFADTTHSQGFQRLSCSVLATPGHLRLRLALAPSALSKLV